MSTLKLAVLGASYLQLPVVLKAKEMGLEVHCFAWDDGRAICKEYADFFYPVSVLEREEILRICKNIDINGILTIATDICIPTIAYVSNEIGLIGNTLKCSELTTDKKLMRELLNKNDFNCPRNLSLKAMDEVDKVDLEFPLIVKPSDRSGSLGVTKVYDKESLKNAVMLALDLSLSNNCIIEEFIEGHEVSVETISYKGTHKVITVTDKVLTKEPYFVELEHHQPSILPNDVIAEINSESLKILDVFGVENGAGHLEFRITNNNKIFLIEIGSRMGGDFIGSDLVKLSTGFDFIEAVIKVSLGDFEWSSFKVESNCSGVFFLGKETDYLLPYFDKDIIGIIKKERTSNDINYLKSSNDRSGYLIYQSNERLKLN